MKIIDNDIENFEKVYVRIQLAQRSCFCSVTLFPSICSRALCVQ